jgi:hypothetical protein
VCEYRGLVGNGRGIATVRDFQKIKYTINKNDNHCKGEGEAADGSLSLPLM